MTAQQLAYERRVEIDALNAAFAEKTTTHNAWLDAVDADQPADELAIVMNESNNEYLRLELSLRIAAEEKVGKGPELGNFWKIVREMRK